MYMLKRLGCFVPLFMLMILCVNAHAQDPDALQFSVQVTPGVLAVSQTLTTRVRITNRSRHAIHVYKDLKYFITAWAYTRSGQGMRKEFFEESTPPPPDRSSFTVLEPGQSIDQLRHERLADLGIHKAGQYRIDFHYNPVFSRRSTFGYPVWMGSRQASILVSVAQ